MTNRRIAAALMTTALALVVAGCHSGNNTTHASAPPTTTPAGDTVPTPAPVTDVPTTSATASVQLLSKKWGPRLDALSSSGAKACRGLHSQACARAVVAADEAARGFLSDTEITGTTGRYIQAKRQAEEMTGSAASYASYDCAGASPKAPESYCLKYAQTAIPGVVVLKAQITADERQAGLR